MKEVKELREKNSDNSMVITRGRGGKEHENKVWREEKIDSN